MNFIQDGFNFKISENYSPKEYCFKIGLKNKQIKKKLSKVNILKRFFYFSFYFQFPKKINEIFKNFMEKVKFYELMLQIFINRRSNVNFEYI